MFLLLFPGASTYHFVPEPIARFGLSGQMDRDKGRKGEGICRALHNLPRSQLLGEIESNIAVR